MKVYVAAPWSHKETAKKIAVSIVKGGLEVVSRWHNNDHSADIYEAPKRVMEDEANKDIADLSNAEAVVYLNLAKSEGKATELGWAIHKGLPIYVIGGKENNVFLHLPQINHVASVEEAIERISDASQS